MDDERPAAVNLIRKPFLIRFRNRKYPFRFRLCFPWPRKGMSMEEARVGLPKYPAPERRYISASRRPLEKLARFYRFRQQVP